MRYNLISYRDKLGGGYALIASFCSSPSSASMVAIDPRRNASIRMSKVDEFEFMLDLSGACEKDRSAVLRLIAQMPDSLEELKVLQTISTI